MSAVQIMGNDSGARTCGACGRRVRRAERFTEEHDVVAHQGACTTAVREGRRAPLRWSRDFQGLSADVPGERERLYVRRDGAAGWRLARSRTHAVAGLLVPEDLTSAGMVTLSHHDTQRLAKAVGEAWASEPWSDGSPLSRATRAGDRVYDALAEEARRAYDESLREYEAAVAAREGQDA